MLLPSKHVNFSESLLGFGSYLLQKLDRPLSVDELWKKYLADLNNELYFARQTFDNLVLTLIFLYSVQAIKEEKGLIIKCN
ncbi:ABC-three component system middle component 6 [Mucilaginibacter sp. P19]|uniref:ABC-three component system middle component 6 n=1 Tax=Mucilaginibacter sp. P19 TaxID=3423947 RepID=UPI003D66C87E